MILNDQYEMNASAKTVVKALPGNTVCCDCGAPNPDWASLSFGNLFCLQCSGIHRSLGTHISFVRSVDMDSWTNEQIKIMKLGGNQQCNQFLQEYTNLDPYKTSIREKYDNSVAQIYKDIIKARATGSSEPSTEQILAMKQEFLEKVNSYTASLTGTSEASDTDDEEGAASKDKLNKSGEMSQNRRRLPSWVESIQKSIPERLSVGWKKRTIVK